MKHVNQTSGKGFLEIDWEAGKATLTSFTKDDELTYDFFKELEAFNKKNVSFSIKEENEIDVIDDK
ncbi:YonK family protein [Solibacillus sp. FSL H8-0523]|uniref:YonK family protein n=1 Tax=Solibacillus sp. FSL H8-0523 TaxID=2954511 RepID=UPI00310149EA